MVMSKKTDKNTLKCKMDVGGFVNFDIENSIATLLVFKKQNHLKGKYQQKDCWYNAS